MNFHYSIGVSGYNYLSIQGYLYSHSELVSENKIRLIQCNIEEKWMKVMEGPVSSKEINTVCTLVYNGSNNSKWEGELVNEYPSGYGNYYEDDHLVYTGFMFEGKKVCYGLLYSPDGKNVQYKGGFYKDKKFGFGILYDSSSDIKYKGEWINDSFNIPKSCEVNGDFNENDIHFGLEQLKICQDCLSNIKQFRLNGLTHLKSLILEDNCLMSVDQFEIENCNELEKVVIGNRCCNYHIGKDCRCWKDDNRSFSIKNCEKLDSITIGNQSFGDYSGSFSMVSMSRIVLITK